MTIGAGPQKNALSDPYDIGWIRVDDSGYTEDEAYAFLTANMSGAFPEADVLTASSNPKAHTGAMIALVPSRGDLERLALEGGEDIEELHLTLAYLGEADAIDEDTRLRIMEAAGPYFTDVIDTEAFSVNVFNPHNAGMETSIVLGIKGEQMAEPHSSLMSAVRGVFDGMPDNHKPWIPHVTLKYTDDVRAENQDDFLSRLGAVTFDTLRFAFAGEYVDVPLRGVDEDVEILSAAFRLWREKDHPRASDGKFADRFGVPTLDIESVTPLRQDKISSSDKIGSLTGTEAKDAIFNLTSASSDYINRELRRKRGKVKQLEAHSASSSPTSVLSAKNVQKTVQNLDTVMENSKLTEDVTVYRGFRNTSSFGSSWNPDGDNTGLTWTEHSFLSTTNDEQFLELNYLPKGSIKLRMSVPKGTGGVYVENVSSDMGQSQPQLLLQRGLKFRIVKDHGDNEGIRTLDVEVVK